MVRYVVHVSDIHIRAGDVSKCRYDEYKRVIDRLVGYVAATLPRDETAAVITGDVFHSKGRVEAPGIKLFHELVGGLAAACSTVHIIRGNHDFRQEAPGESDLVGCLLRNCGLANVRYLDSTGHHPVDGSLGFGLVAIHDALLLGCSTGVRDDLPPFPPADALPCERRLALFHGTVNRSRAKPGSLNLNTGYPADWFGDGYDAVLLGDVHLQQVVAGGESMELQRPEPQDPHPVTVLQRYRMTKGMLAYAGSMVQQDFGETLLGHGFLLWDLQERVLSCAHVHNDSGYITLNVHDEVQVRFADTNAWLPLDAASRAPWFPRKVVVRGSAAEAAERACSRCSLEVLGAPTTLFQKDKDKTSKDAADMPEDVAAASSADADDLARLCSVDAWVKYVGGNVPAEELAYEGWEDWLRRPGETLKLEAPNADREARIAKKVDAYLDGAQRGAHHSFKLLHMDWEWLLCFKDRNAFDFTGMDGQISVLNGRNGQGKTSFLECACIALFGEGFPSRHSKTYTASIINNQKPYHCTAYVQLRLDTPAGEFTIKRAFHAAEDPNKVLTTAKETYVRGPDSVGVVAKGKSAVDKWVTEHVGTQDSFLMSCMLTQSSDRDFFNLPSAAQKQMLDAALNLDVHGRMMEALREARLAQVVAVNSVGDKLSLLKAQQSAQQQQNRSEDEDDPVAELQAAVDVFEAQKREAGASGGGAAGGGTGAGGFASLQAAQAALDGELADVDVQPEEREDVEAQLATLGVLLQQSAPYAAAHFCKDAEEDGDSEPSKAFEAARDDLKALQRWKKLDKREDEPEGGDGLFLTEEEASAAWEAVMQRKPPAPSKLLPVAPAALTPEEQARRAELKTREGLATAGATQWQPADAARLAALEAKFGSDEQQADPDAPLPPRPEVMRKDWTRTKFMEMSKQLEYDLSDEEQVRAYRDGLTKKVARFEEAERELKEVARQAERYVNHPFNPSCDACKRAPWRTHSEELAAKEAQLKARLQKLGSDKQALLDERVGLERNLALMAELKLMEPALQYQDAAERRELARLLLARDAHELARLDNRARAAEHDAWAAEERAAKTAWDAARQQGERRQYLEDVKLRGTPEENAAACRRWAAVFARRAAALRQKRAKLAALGAVAHFRAADLDARLLEAKLQLNLALKERERAQQAAALRDELAAQQALLQRKSATMEKIIECLGGYQAWLYRAAVLPTVCRHVNAILDVMGLDPALRLSCVFQDGASTDLAWFLGRPPLCRASGFQRFITGLGMRIAISRIGASEMRNRQLVIDEGFTACDAANLAKVPNFLRGLLKMYDSILLVTHLEELKDAVDCVYDVGVDFKAPS